MQPISERSVVFSDTGTEAEQQGVLALQAKLMFHEALKMLLSFASLRLLAKLHTLFSNNKSQGLCEYP